MDSTTTPSKRTGGRSAAVIHSVRTAVEELVREKGSDRVTVPMIAERAGVNPTSIYRRWGDLPTLLNTSPPTGSTRTARSPSTMRCATT